MTIAPIVDNSIKRLRALFCYLAPHFFRRYAWRKKQQTPFS
jgi:hypothetical protein